MEERVTRLEELPARVDALTLEVSQLRGEMRVEFSAVRDEMRAGDARVMEQARVLHEDLVERLAVIGEGRASKRQRRKSR